MGPVHHFSRGDLTYSFRERKRIEVATDEVGGCRVGPVIVVGPSKPIFFLWVDSVNGLLCSKLKSNVYVIYTETGTSTVTPLEQCPAQISEKMMIQQTRIQEDCYIKNKRLEQNKIILMGEFAGEAKPK